MLNRWLTHYYSMIGTPPGVEGCACPGAVARSDDLGVVGLGYSDGWGLSVALEGVGGDEDFSGYKY